MTKKNSKIITLVCVVAFVVLCAYLISVGTAPGKTDCPSPETIDKQFNTSISSFPEHFSKSTEKAADGSEIYCYGVGMKDPSVDDVAVRLSRKSFVSVPKESDYTFLKETKWDGLTIQTYTAEKAEPYKPYFVITFNDEDGYYNIRTKIDAEYKADEALREEDLQRIKTVADQVKKRN